ncbi:multicopper oxidase domain-containing protein, partial [Dysgonomonas sp. ZJ279]|uniref:multicopper oxidase domain-containing protein n=1 Tax=Dysgonomonas sp. ZJ279 TaxID=2709796 RepID=UPI0013E9E991
MKKISKILFSIFVLSVTIPTVKSQNIKEYNLYINDTIVNYTGKNKKAIAANGQIPMPTLYFTEGDTAVVDVHNNMMHETSIHWHGLLLPN